MNALFDLLHQELRYKTSRSSGAGGQNVNKVESRVELLFDINNSANLTDDQKELLNLKLNNKINKEGVLLLSCQSARSQFENKRLVVLKFDELLIQSFKTNKARKASKPKKSAIEKRLNAKKQHGMVKLMRKKL